MYAWTTGRGDVIAQYLTRAEIQAHSQGLLQKLVVGPNEAAVFVRNGRVDEVLTQAKVQKLSGGFLNLLANRLGGGDDVRVLFVATSPIELSIPFGGETVRGRPPGPSERLLTKDGRPAVGALTARLVFDVQNAPKVFNLLQTTRSSAKGRGDALPANVLTKSDLSERLHDEVVSNVLASFLRERNYADLAGNEAARQELDATMLSYLRKSFETFGITLDQAFARFDPTEFDRLQELAGEKELEERTKDIAFASQLGDERRASDLAKARDQFQAELLIQHEQNAQVLARLQEEVVDVHYDAGRGRVNRQREDDLAHERAVADEHHRQLSQRHELYAQREREETENDLRTLEALAKIRTTQTETEGRIRLESEQIRAGSDVEKEKYRAQGAAASVETFKSGLNTAFGHTERMATLQGPARSGANPTAPAPPIHDPPSGRAASKSAKGSKCPSCGAPVRSTWKVCPECEKSLVTAPSGSARCPRCDEELRSTWKTCPSCGTPRPPSGPGTSDA